MKKSLFLLYILIFALLLLVGCSKPNMTINGQTSVAVGQTVSLTVTTSSNEPVVWRSSDKNIATVSKGVVKGVASGEVTIYATCGKESAQIKIKVVGEAEVVETKDPFYDQAASVVSSMSLEQKIGELFIITCSSASDSKTANLLKRKHIGNVILDTRNVKTKDEAVELVNDIQNLILSGNKVPGFVINYKEESYSYKLFDEMAEFPSNLAVSATGKAKNAYNVAYAFGTEMRTFGFGATLGPNMALSYSSLSAYSDEEEVVYEYASKEIEGYSYAGVMSIAYNFPGTTESRYGDMPSSLKAKDVIVREDMAPFIKAFENDELDAVMASLTIFTNYDNTYPATLSYPVITTLLREDLDYKGLILSNYLDNALLCENYRGGEDNPAVLALSAGVDMLVYQGYEYVDLDYNTVVEAVQNGVIDEKQIDESVIRIITKKYKYDLIDSNHYAPVWNASEYDITEDENILYDIALETVCLLEGELPAMSQDQRILIVSSNSPDAKLDTYDINAKENSFAYLCKRGLESYGYKNITWDAVDSMDSREFRNYTWSTDEYDLCIFAISNISNDRWRRTTFGDGNIIFISLFTPADTSRVANADAYVCTYGYGKFNVQAAISCLVGELQMVDRRVIDDEE